ncbi:MAG: hypothetical protein HZA03_03100 [Nitrospinae bacterium]|nr:hypothetical protein [Nitrospinota bacterium]
MKKLLITVALAVFLAACGGGGSGTAATTTTTTSTVATSQATVSSSNASTITSSATTNLNMAQSIAVAYHLKPYFKPGSAAPVYDDGFGKPLADAIAALDGPRATGSYTGSCGGTLTYTTSATSASFVFASYCSGGTTINGTISATGSSSSATVTISNLTVSTSSSSVSMDGTFTAAMTATSNTFTMTLTVTATSGGTTYYAKMENFKMTLTISGSTYSETVTGRFYYNTTGYVDITTPAAITGTYSTGYIGSPKSGEMRLTGGGSTIARVVYTNGVAAYSYSTNGGTSWTAI